MAAFFGEFGRTPKINSQGGRDHHTRVSSTVLIGGGIRAGQVIGRTDVDGAHVEDRPMCAPEFMATLCDILGIDWRKIHEGPGGRTVRLVDKIATPIRELRA